MNAYSIIIPYPSYPSKHPYIRFYHSISPSLFYKKRRHFWKNNRASREQRGLGKSNKASYHFLFSRYNRLVIFKFITKSITKEQICITKILKAKHDKKRVDSALKWLYRGYVLKTGSYLILEKTFITAYPLKFHIVS